MFAAAAPQQLVSNAGLHLCSGCGNNAEKLRPEDRKGEFGRGKKFKL